jgi:hypothetical protein
VYKLQNPGSRLKYKLFVLEAGDYWAGMRLEEAYEEDDVEAPRRHPVGDCQET